MKIGNCTYRRKATSILLAGIGGAVLLFGVTSRFPVWPSAWGPKAVLASSHYGIRGQAAPELKLDGWIDGDGNADDLAKGASATGTKDYVVLASDLGTDIVNVATASSVEAPNVTEANTVPVPKPRLSITKTNTLHIDADGSGDVSAGDTIRYSYKVDKYTEEVLPLLEDKHNHIIDPLRYATEGVMKTLKPHKPKPVETPSYQPSGWQSM